MLTVSEFQEEKGIKASLDEYYPDITTPVQLEDVREIVQTALQKLKISGLMNPDTSLKCFIISCFDYVSDANIRGPTSLSWDYYNNNGGYYRNSQFLFGAASQFR